MKQSLWGLLFRHQHPKSQPMWSELPMRFSQSAFLLFCLEQVLAVQSKLSIIMSPQLYRWLVTNMQQTSKNHHGEEDPGDGKGQDNFTKWKHWWLHWTFIAVGGFECQPTHWSMNANCGPKNSRKQKHSQTVARVWKYCSRWDLNLLFKVSLGSLLLIWRKLYNS